MSLSTHILDITKGRPVAGVAVSLLKFNTDTWSNVANESTNQDGRVALALMSNLNPGSYKLTFNVKPYFEKNGSATCFPIIEIAFEIADTKSGLHIPLLLGPFGYTTYRGS